MLRARSLSASWVTLTVHDVAETDMDTVHLHRARARARAEGLGCPFCVCLRHVLDNEREEAERIEKDQTSRILEQ